MTYAIESGRRTFGTYKDTNGCGNGAVSFDPGPIVVPKGFTMRAIYFDLCPKDTNGHATGGEDPEDGCAPTKKFTNWRLE